MSPLFKHGRLSYNPSYFRRVHKNPVFGKIDYAVGGCALPRAGAASGVHYIKTVFPPDKRNVGMTEKKNVRSPAFRFGNRLFQAALYPKTIAVGVKYALLSFARNEEGMVEASFINGEQKYGKILVEQSFQSSP